MSRVTGTSHPHLSFNSSWMLYSCIPLSLRPHSIRYLKTFSLWSTGLQLFPRTNKTCSMKTIKNNSFQVPFLSIPNFLNFWLALPTLPHKHTHSCTQIHHKLCMFIVYIHLDGHFQFTWTCTYLPRYVYYDIYIHNCSYIIFHRSLSSLIISFSHYQHFSNDVNNTLLNRSAQTQESSPAFVSVTGGYNTDIRIRLLLPMYRYVTAWFQLVKSACIAAPPLSWDFVKRKVCDEKIV